MKLKHFFRRARPDATAPNATIIDLSANPDNFSPAINHIVTSIQDARAADQKVIVMLGELHDTISHVALAPLLRRALQDAGNKDKPVLALEERHNSLEYFLCYIMAQTPSALPAAAPRALQNLKQDNPEHYHRLQAQAVAAHKWPQTPLTRLESVLDWLREQSPVHLIDVAKTMSNQIDMNDPATATFVKVGSEKKVAALSASSPEGVRLRNQWMVASLQEINNRHDLTLFQTGLLHLGGFLEHLPYQYSLHGSVLQTDPTVKIITVFPESRYENQIFAGLLSPEAQKAMNNPDTIIIRGGNETRHQQSKVGSINEEITTLRKIFRASGMPDNTLSIDEADYENKRIELGTSIHQDLTELSKKVEQKNSKSWFRNLLHI